MAITYYALSVFHGKLLYCIHDLMTLGFVWAFSFEKVEILQNKSDFEVICYLKIVNDHATNIFVSMQVFSMYHNIYDTELLFCATTKYLNIRGK